MVRAMKRLTKDERDWFGDSLTESRTGVIRVPKYLRVKLSKILGFETMHDEEIKDYLIDTCY